MGTRNVLPTSPLLDLTDMEIDELEKRLEPSVASPTLHVAWLGAKPVEVLCARLASACNGSVGGALVIIALTVVVASVISGNIATYDSEWIAWPIIGAAILLALATREIARAVMYRSFGMSVRDVGISFRYFVPLLRIDHYRPLFVEPRVRAAIAIAGVAAQCIVLGLVAALTFTEPHALSGFVELALIVALALQLNPLNRGDGYEICSALLNIPGMHEGLGRLLVARLHLGRAGVAEYFRPVAVRWLAAYGALLVIAWTIALVVLVDAGARLPHILPWFQSLQFVRYSSRGTFTSVVEIFASVSLWWFIGSEMWLACRNGLMQARHVRSRRAAMVSPEFRRRSANG